MARAAPGGAGGFLGGVAQNVAANLLGAVLGALCMSFGLAREASLTGLQSWPAWVALTGALLTASIAANLAYLAARYARRRAIGRAKAAQPSILIAKIEGDDEHQSRRDEMVAQLERHLGAGVSVTTWPEPMPRTEGRSEDRSALIARVTRRWLRQTRCDMLIWGHVKGERSLALHLSTPADTGERRTYGLTDITLELTDLFPADAAATLVGKVLGDIRALEGVEFDRRAGDRHRARCQRLLAVVQEPDARVKLLNGYGHMLVRLAVVTESLPDAEEARRIFAEALGLAKRDGRQVEWARAKIGLATACRLVATRTYSKTEMRAALTHLDEGLAVLDPQQEPVLFGLAKSGTVKASALLNVGVDRTVIDRQRMLIEEILSFATANRLDWLRAEAQGLEVYRLILIGDLDDDPEILERAILLSSEAQIYDNRLDRPFAWTWLELQKGYANRVLGMRDETSLDHIQKCIANYEAALSVSLAHGFQELSFYLQAELAAALSVSGATNGNHAILLRSVKLSQRALEGLAGTPDVASLISAKITYSCCHVNLAELVRDPELCDPAIAEATSGLELVDVEVEAHTAANLYFQIAQAWDARERMSGDCSAMQHARSAYETAHRLYSKIGHVRMRQLVTEKLAGVEARLAG